MHNRSDRRSRCVSRWHNRGGRPVGRQTKARRPGHARIVDIDGSGRFRARSSPGSAAPRRSRRPLERARRARSTAKEGAIRCRFFGRLPRRTARGARARLEKLRRLAGRCPPAFGGARRRAGARAGCGCSATSSVVPDGSGAFYHCHNATQRSHHVKHSKGHALTGRLCESLRGLWGGPRRASCHVPGGGSTGQRGVLSEGRLRWVRN